MIYTGRFIQGLVLTGLTVLTCSQGGGKRSSYYCNKEYLNEINFDSDVFFSVLCKDLKGY